MHWFLIKNVTLTLPKHLYIFEKKKAFFFKGVEGKFVYHYEIIVFLKFIHFIFSIKFMMNELDPDNIGVILYHKFVEAFFTPEQSYTPPDTFIVYHYNGLESSCPMGKVGP